MNIVKVMKTLGGKDHMTNRKEPLIPTIGVVTDIRIDTPDVKTFRVVTPDGEKGLRPQARPVRDAVHPGRG